MAKTTPPPRRLALPSSGWFYTSCFTVAIASALVAEYFVPARDIAIQALLYGLALLMSTLAGLLFAARRLLTAFATSWDMPITAVFALLVFAVFPLLFGVLCRSLFLLYGGFVGVPVAHSSISSTNDWYAFGYAWLLDTLSFNGTQIFHWSTTPISPTAWWSGGLLWAYCIVADVIILAGVLNFARMLVAVVSKLLRRGARDA